ncbi:hypothetical protein [Methylobacterium sp.]|uniref:hypothetical protein n=1 Tax=Methylobacterium sp. TaxID=409 RepID=UPI003C708F05
MTEPEQGSAEAVYVSAMVDEMMRRVLNDALVDLARTKGSGYLDTFLQRELTRYVDLFRERSGDTAEITDTLRAWFLTEGSTALRTVIARAKSDAAHE